MLKVKDNDTRREKILGAHWVLSQKDGFKQIVGVPACHPEVFSISATACHLDINQDNW